MTAPHRVLSVAVSVEKYTQIISVEGIEKPARPRRLVSLMTNASVDASEVTRIANESAVVRTRIRMRNFSDQMNQPAQEAPAERPAGNPSVPSGGRSALEADQSVPEKAWTRIDSSAETEVTYKQDAAIGLWLPSRMSESYTGPMRGTRATVEGRANTRATYSDFKQFGTAAVINVPK